MEELGKKLKELRLQRGGTQREAARALGISNTRLSDYERGITHSTHRPAIPSRETLAKMADYYGYPLESLLALAGYPLIEPTVPAVPPEVEMGVQEVADIFRRLPEHQRSLFLKVARAFKS